MKVTNNTRETLNFNVKGGKVKDGVPETCHIEPGETADLDIDQDSAAVQGYVAAGAISVPDKVAQRVESQVAAPPASKAK